MKNLAFIFILGILLAGMSFVLAENESNQQTDNDSDLLISPNPTTTDSTTTTTINSAQKGKDLDMNAIKNLKDKIKANEEEIKQLKSEIKENKKLRINEKNIDINVLTDDQKEIIAEKINAKTGLNLSSEDIDNKTILRALLSNGRNAEVKIMPNTASETAIKRLNTQCEERNCTVELKEVGTGTEKKLAYEVRTENNAKVLFLFKNKKVLTAQVDAETGEIIPGSVKKPWWSFMARDSK
ncbi:MAG: hypothetical protein Q7S33_04480 [Nanoarchaeota archaeon]|nr:hypothetical protein [Nanoarchaeota archaeon]